MQLDEAFRIVVSPCLPPDQIVLLNPQLFNEEDDDRIALGFQSESLADRFRRVAEDPGIQKKLRSHMAILKGTE